jgi:hypothetical protein
MNSQTDGSTHMSSGWGPRGSEGIIMDNVCTQRKNGLQNTLATFL